MKISSFISLIVLIISIVLLLTNWQAMVIFWIGITIESFYVVFLKRNM